MKKELFIVGLCFVIGLTGCQTSQTSEETTQSTEVKEPLKEYTLLNDACETAKIEIVEPEIPIFEKQKFYANSSELQIQYYQGKKKLIISKKVKGEKESSPIFTKKIGNKTIKFFGDKEATSCSWNIFDYNYSIKWENFKPSQSFIASIADETDPEDLTVDKSYAEEDLKAMNVSVNKDEESITVTDFPETVDTRRQAIYTIQELEPILKIPENEIQFESIHSNQDKVSVIFSQVYGEMNVEFRKITLTSTHGKTTIHSEYKPVSRLNKTSTITEKDAREKSGLTNIKNVQKTIFTGNESVIAYFIQNDSKSVYLSALDGKILKEENNGK